MPAETRIPNANVVDVLHLGSSGGDVYLGRQGGTLPGPEAPAIARRALDAVPEAASFTVT